MQLKRKSLCFKLSQPQYDYKYSMNGWMITSYYSSWI